MSDSPAHIRTDALQPRGWRGEIPCALLIAFASLTLIAKCWNANFLSYDDLVHIHDVPQIFGNGSVWDLFKVPDDTYRPITFLSYRLDYLLFGEWMQARWDTWAPGIRIMNWVYHAAASIVLWRLLLEIGLGRGGALFVALVFAVHPTACESVCWVSERKNIFPL